jgi:hypothetical protein
VFEVLTLTNFKNGTVIAVCSPNCSKVCFLAIII